jgi:DNA-binding protein H-NS
MSIDLSGLSPKELKQLITQAKKQQNALNKRKPIAQVRSKLVALAKAEGYTIAELFGAAKAPAAPRAAKAAKPSPNKGRKVLPKYRNPDNPKETWSGRGNQPRWMAALVAKGRKVEEFAIK